MTTIENAAGVSPITAKNDSQVISEYSTIEFFEAVLPPTGPYQLRWSRREEKKIIGSLYVDSVNELTSEALKLNAKGFQMYFGTASYSQRSGSADFNNVKEKQVFYIDIDVGKGKDYDTPQEAGTAVNKAVKALALPKPMIVISGTGFHVYWVLTEAIGRDAWVPIAKTLKAKLKAQGLKTDAKITADAARILRPVGCAHRKTSTDIAVKVIFSKFEATDVEDFQKLLGHEDDPLAGANKLTGIFAPAADLEVVTEYPPSDADAVARNCAFVKEFKETGFGGGGKEPQWYDAIGIVKHCIDGEGKCHEYSEAADNYDKGGTQEKVDQWDKGPTTCKHVNENYNYCDGCIHKGHVTAPIQLGQENNHSEWGMRMNRQYAWIEADAGIYRILHRDFISQEKFNATHANDLVEIKKDDGKEIKIPASKAWLGNKYRREHARIVLRPDQPEVTEKNELNEWRGFSVEPIPGNVDPWLNLYTRMLDGKTRPLQWISHKVQLPGVKQHTCLALWSNSQGVGKNLLVESVGMLFHPYHYELITQSEVDDSFTGWMPGTVFVIGDEIHSSRKPAARDRTKTWITSTTLKSHDKGQPKRTIENMMDFIFLSNHPDALSPDENDRRIDPYEVKTGPLPDDLADEFILWRDNGGLGHLLYFLQNYDLAGYNPKARATLTDDKLNMIESSRSDLERFCRDVVTGSVPLARNIVTGEEVARKFLIEYDIRGSAPQASTVSKILIQMGAYARPNQIRKSNGRKVRCLAVAQIEYWKKQHESAWRVEIEKSNTAWGQS